MVLDTHFIVLYSNNFNRLGGLSLPMRSVVRFTDRPNMTLAVYREGKTTTHQQKQQATYKAHLSSTIKDVTITNKKLFDF